LAAISTGDKVQFEYVPEGTEVPASGNKLYYSQNAYGEENIICETGNEITEYSLYENPARKNITIKVGVRKLSGADYPSVMIDSYDSTTGQTSSSMGQYTYELYREQCVAYRNLGYSVWPAPVIRVCSDELNELGDPLIDRIASNTSFVNCMNSSGDGWGTSTINDIPLNDDYGNLKIVADDVPGFDCKITKASETSTNITYEVTYTFTGKMYECYTIHLPDLYSPLADVLEMDSKKDVGHLRPVITLFNDGETEYDRCVIPNEFGSTYIHKEIDMTQTSVPDKRYIAAMDEIAGQMPVSDIIANKLDSIYLSMYDMDDDCLFGSVKLSDIESSVTLTPINCFWGFKLKLFDYCEIRSGKEGSGGKYLEFDLKTKNNSYKFLLVNMSAHMFQYVFNAYSSMSLARENMVTFLRLILQYLATHMDPTDAESILSEIGDITEFGRYCYNNIQDKGPVVAGYGDMVFSSSGICSQYYYNFSDNPSDIDYLVICNVTHISQNIYPFRNMPKLRRINLHNLVLSGYVNYFYESSFSELNFNNCRFSASSTNYSGVSMYMIRSITGLEIIGCPNLTTIYASSPCINWYYMFNYQSGSPSNNPFSKLQCTNLAHVYVNESAVGYKNALSAYPTRLYNIEAANSRGGLGVFSTVSPIYPSSLPSDQLSILDAVKLQKYGGVLELDPTLENEEV